MSIGCAGVSPEDRDPGIAPAAWDHRRVEVVSIAKVIGLLLVGVLTGAGAGFAMACIWSPGWGWPSRERGWRAVRVGALLGLLLVIWLVVDPG